jgi:hypothetical protein
MNPVTVHVVKKSRCERRWITPTFHIQIPRGFCGFGFCGFKFSVATLRFAILVVTSIVVYWVLESSSTRFVAAQHGKCSEDMSET